MTLTFKKLTHQANIRKFFEDRPKDLGEVGEQTEKTRPTEKNINLTFDLDDL